MISFYNTMSGRVEEFVPLEPGQVRMYTCGPTVYDYAHIGNYRTFVFGDILRRHLRRSGFQLLHVMNITDVDDKTIQNAAAAGLALPEYTERYLQAFLEDTAALRLEGPERLVRATAHIPDMVRTIRQLEEKGYTYRSDGSIYFRIANFPSYGKLSKIDFSGMRPGARVDRDEYEKADVRDFVLWKAPKPGEPSWDTELGPGRPGWHIECSVMATKYLGESFDIHAGGVDLIFPHHENEIAQSESLTGKPFARYWLHCEHLLVDGQKMSKSLGNYFTLRDLLRQGHTAESIRYLLLSVPHGKQLNFTMEGLRQAANSIDRLENFLFRVSQTSFPEGVNSAIEAKTAFFPEAFGKALDDDLNTAQALGVLFELVRDVNIAIDAEELRNGNIKAILKCLENANDILDVLSPAPETLTGAALPGGRAAAVTAAVGDGVPSSEEIERRLQERTEAREQRKFALADQIRDELEAAGVLIEDTKDAVRWRRK
ncbi:MAG: cysteine--tRNA ligase [Acidobacteria bacterium]|nr:cysteine--tRNA ligase [Acidobacteriota bacterium]